MKTLPVIILCLLVLLAAPSGIWCREEMEYQTKNWPNSYNKGKRSMTSINKRRVDILSAPEKDDGI
uniref:Venom peptide Htgkr19 n=1 Tax=Hadogenes troglodytes TaxID=1577150 RepID=A0A1B3IJA7_9SCOR|nr:venom peptide Htgkr19 [Hadogenes troglodytes]